MQNNKSIDKIAQKILDNLKTNNIKDYGIDPITIIIIISVILSLIRVIQECKKKRNLLKDKREAATLMKRDIQDLILKDSWLNRLRLQKIIRQKLSKEQYKIYGKNLQDSIMEVGINLTDDEVYTLLMETSND